MKPSVAIVDYGMGNLRSVQNAVEAVGSRADVVAVPGDLAGYESIILPGVGAFAQAMAALRAAGMGQALEERRQAGIPILGICLGMQLMCTDSEEDGHYGGLAWFNAHVRRLPDAAGLRIPHMGWNTVDFVRHDPLFAELESGSDAYFLHSYRVECRDANDVLATAEYGSSFACVIQRDNLRGIQFHPEKSQSFGLALLRNFLAVRP